MKVLLLGATGNLGTRLVPALLTHGHTVTTYVRSTTKLQSLFPATIVSQLSVIQGSATDVDAVKTAILDSACDAVINTAGVAGMAPWAKSDLPEIFAAVVEAVRQAGRERGRPLRVWLLAGMSVMKYPGTESMICDFMPVYITHRQNLQLLQSLPPDSMDWSLLCPNTMIPETSEFVVPTKSSHPRLRANATTPPAWQDSWLGYIPLIGKSLVVAMNNGRYLTTLEQNADFIAEDLEQFESRWSGKAVGIIDESR